MNLEPIIQNEVSQRERQILYIDIYIWNRERWSRWSYLQGSKGDADIKDRLLDTVEEGEGGMIWESSIETLYITICKIDSQWAFGVWLRKPNLMLCDNLEGWKVRGRFKREGIYVYLWLIHVDIWQKPSQYCKEIILQLNIKWNF